MGVASGAGLELEVGTCCTQERGHFCTAGLLTTCSRLQRSLCQLLRRPMRRLLRPRRVGFRLRVRPLLQTPPLSSPFSIAPNSPPPPSPSQGVVSVILVMPQFLARFPSVAETAAGSGFYKGLLTAMIELGALAGALNQGWIADRYSRKYSIVGAVGVFVVGSALQTAAVDYPMLTVARLVGGVGIGMLSMVVPLYIAEISPPEVRGALLVLEEFCIVTGIVIAFVGLR